MPGTLYIVATPIGNLSDITLRALSILREVDLVAAEDTRVTHNLLKHYGIDTPTTPYHQHSLGRKAHQIIDMVKAGQSIAVVSDAGTPGISDPGHELIALAITEDVPLVMIPGPNAIVTALVLSGLPTRRFTFEGFPPRKGRERRAIFNELKGERRTMVFYESPHRFLGTLKDMLEAWGDRPMAAVREATKMFEEVHRGTIGSIIEDYEARQPRGEYTLVIGGSPEPQEAEESVDDIDAALRAAIQGGLSDRDAVKEVASKFSVPKKDIYRRMLDIKGSSPEEE